MSAASCERAMEVEDLILGLGAADDLEAHVETCADCTDAKAMFLAERSLFEARPQMAAPPLELPKRTSVGQSVVRVLRPLGSHRLVPAVAAMAACMAAFIGRPPAADDCAPPTPVVVITSDEISTSSLGATALCRAPLAEAPAPAVSLASHDTNACVPSPSATCDVTSSTATP